MYAPGACNGVREFESSCWMQSQLQCSEHNGIVLVTDGRVVSYYFDIINIGYKNKLKMHLHYDCVYTP